MEIRKLEERDFDGVLRLLGEVCRVHARLRPDIFVDGGSKYSAEGLRKLMADPHAPVFVGCEGGAVVGYAMCRVQDFPGGDARRAMRELYVDDICVDESARKRGVATELFAYVKAYAGMIGAYELTLNVWEGNSPARAFYEKMGMTVQKTTMELIL